MVIVVKSKCEGQFQAVFIVAKLHGSRQISHVVFPFEFRLGAVEPRFAEGGDRVVFKPCIELSKREESGGIPDTALPS